LNENELYSILEESYYLAGAKAVNCPGSTNANAGRINASVIHKQPQPNTLDSHLTTQPWRKQ
jgi:hypothetical protein